MQTAKHVAAAVASGLSQKEYLHFSPQSQLITTLALSCCPTAFVALTDPSRQTMKAKSTEPFLISPPKFWFHFLTMSGSVKKFGQRHQICCSYKVTELLVLVHENDAEDVEVRGYQEEDR